MMNYFENVKTIEELKKAYFKAAEESHPNHGGNVEIMKILNNQYAELQVKLKNVHTSHNGDGKTYTATKETAEVPEDSLNMEMCAGL